MTENPYDILGISRDATPDEVKKAYRKKARENHPDLHPNDPSAADRMNAINEAYDRIMNPEKYAARDRRANAAGTTAQSTANSRSAGGGYASSASYTSDTQHGYGGGSRQYGWTGGFDWADFDDIFGFGGSGFSSAPIRPEAGAGDSAEFRAAIDAINAKQYQRALGILSQVVSTYRTARWYYLSALANNGAGNTMKALEQIKRAVQMDPSNQDYQRARRQFQQTSQTYQQDTTAHGFSVGIDPLTICCGIWCCSSMIGSPYMMMCCR